MPPLITFAGSDLDRAGHLRIDADWLAARRDDPKALFAPIWRLRPLMRLGETLSIHWQNRAAMAPFLDAGAMAVFLGLRDGRPLFAVDVSGDSDGDVGNRGGKRPFADDGKYIDVRSVAQQADRTTAAILAQSRSMIDWHARHRFCAVCGQPSEPREGGYMRQCRDEACGAQHFPRTDPVTIMLVLDGRRCMMGRQPRFPPGNFSALAGFVEPGESIEEAVRREVKEEVGLEVGAVRYIASQPWPFPSSLMIGCFATAESTEIAVDPAELEDARWFSRDQVAEMTANWRNQSALRMPPPFSIAHQLARAWLEETGA